MKPTSAQFATHARAHIVRAQLNRFERGFEDVILQVEADVPGIGGMFRDESGEMVVYLKDVTRSQIAIDRIRQVPHRLPPAFMTSLRDAEPVRVVIGQYTFSELVTFKELLANTLLRNRDVRGVDADERYNRVTVEVRSMAAANQVLVAVATAGVPVSAIRFVEQPNGEDVLLNNLRRVNRPTFAGLEVARGAPADPQNPTEVYPTVCTLGFNVMDTQGVRYGITAAHCMDSFFFSGGQFSLVFGQPWNTYRIAGQVFMPSGTGVPGCPVNYCFDADAMLLRYDDSVSSDRRIAHTEYVGQNGAKGSITITGTRPVNSTISLAGNGDVIDKMGRSTGWTRGVQTETCMARTATFQGTPSYTLQVNCAGTVENARAYSGDSGAGVYFQNGELKNPVGILYGATVYTGPTGNPVPCDETQFRQCQYRYSTLANVMAEHGINFTP
jgi:hypothetical protein